MKYKGQTKTILTGRNYYAQGNDKEKYTITVKDGDIIKWTFNSFREGGEYKVRKSNELNELVTIYNEALTYSKREADFFLQFIDTTTKYSKKEVLDKDREKKFKNKQAQKKYYKNKIEFYTKKLKELE